MKNEAIIYTIIICVCLIFYGIFSFSFAMDSMFPQKTDTSAQPVEEIITLAGNKIEIYDI